MPTDDPPSPAFATKAFAGSAEKIEVMRRRHRAGESIHHHADASLKVDQRVDPDPPPGVLTPQGE